MNVVLALWMALSVAFAGRVEWVAQVQDLVEGQSATVQLLVYQGRTKRAPELPVGRGLKVQYVGSRQTIQSINMGRLTQVHAYEYRVTAMEQGDWSIGPGTLSLVDGSQQKVDELVIHVDERGADSVGPDLEAVAGFDRAAAYVGEVVLYHYRGAARAHMVDISWRLPEFEGLRQPGDGSPVEREYVVDDPSGPVVVKEGWWPFVVTRPQSLDLPGALARFSLHAGRADPFGFAKRNLEQRVTKPVHLEIHPLPPPPSRYTGLVGEFEFASKLGRREASVGDSVTWTIEVIGNGTVEGLDLHLPVLEGVTVYEGDPATRAVVERGEFTALARFEHVLVPTREGVVDPGPVEVVVFSPKAGAYVTKRIPFPSLSVSGGDATSAEVTSYGEDGSERVASVVPGMRPPRVRGRVRRVAVEQGLPWVWCLLVLPGLMALGSTFLRKVRELRPRTVEEHVPRPSDYLNDLPEDLEARCQRLDAALQCALAHRLDRVHERASREELLEGVQDWGGRAELLVLFADLDRGQYASVTDGTDLLARTVEFIERLA